MPDAQDPQAPPQSIAAVVDEGQAMLLDPGPSAAHGTRAQQSLAFRLRAWLRWVLLTHGDPDSVRGLQGPDVPEA
jgi:glyoxylase-like metal-dependent hydrolase (beta-lactamase superfamily II)